jgi:hypothetical protein
MPMGLHISVIGSKKINNCLAAWSRTLIYLFVLGLSDNAAITPDYIPSNGRIINE